MCLMQAVFVVHGTDGDCLGLPGSSEVSNVPQGVGFPPGSDVESRWEEIV